MKKINLNDFIKVKLTDLGKKIYYDKLDDIITANNLTCITPKMPDVDDEGYTQFQLWNFMNTYGEYLFNGSPIKIIEEIFIYIDEKYIEEVE